LTSPNCEEKVTLPNLHSVGPEQSTTSLESEETVCLDVTRNDQSVVTEQLIGAECQERVSSCAILNSLSITTEQLTSPTCEGRVCINVIPIAQSISTARLTSPECDDEESSG